MLGDETGCSAGLGAGGGVLGTAGVAGLVSTFLADASEESLDFLGTASLFKLTSTPSTSPLT